MFDILFCTFQKSLQLGREYTNIRYKSESNAINSGVGDTPISTPTMLSSSASFNLPTPIGSLRPK